MTLAFREAMIGFKRAPMLSVLSITTIAAYAFSRFRFRGRIAMLKGKAWAARLYLVFAGMLIYSVINSPGYFAQQGQGIFVVMFIIVMTIIGYLS
mgnify:CR=1 FL=1